MQVSRSLPGNGERAYAYAKACGMIGKSFVGKRLYILEKAGRLSELDRIVFPASPQNLPEKELLVDLEKRILAREVESVISILKSFSKPPEFFRRLVLGYEYADLLSAISASVEKEKASPAHTDLGHFQTVHFEAWPDVPAMIEGTEFEFLLDKKPGFGLGQEMQSNSGMSKLSLQSELDKHYYKSLWNSLFSLPLNDRRAATKILSDEISLKNCSWVLRLRTYYRMQSDEIKSLLISLPSSLKKQNKKSRSSLSDDATRSLGFPLDDFSAWSSWRWKEFLNTGSSGRQWHADPQYFQNAASRYLYQLARRNFHRNPFSLDTVFCFIKLKQFEEDILTSSAEALAIGMSIKDLISMLEVRP
jgi:vacuolar-type H+-ATPase subunit C/Vma6